MRTLRTVAALSAVLALASCGLPRTIAGSASQAPVSTATVTAPSTPTVTAPVPQTVYVPPPQTVTAAPAGVAATSQWYAQPGWINAQSWIAITPSAGQTPCQWLRARGYSYAQAYAAWAQNGYPASWSATNDGYPCQKSYGMQH
ncbi:hypothetical protein [Amycolatopsis sp. cmx-4-83]|uniref:hypothetical protein n=1 Tax=Amycolatopsis sp. cmx-4-83 TaxID=2790940 RepID=UPI00397DF527